MLHVRGYSDQPTRNDTTHENAPKFVKSNSDKGFEILQLNNDKCYKRYQGTCIWNAWFHL